MRTFLISLAALLSFAPLAHANDPYLVKDINTHVAPTGSYPDHFLTAGNYTYFTATDGYGYPLELWRSDGTEAGTIDLHAANSRPVAFNGKIWFTTSANEIWSTDGTVAGTQQLTLPSVTPALTPKHDLMATSTGLYFYSAQYNASLWVTDGTTGGTHQVGGPFTAADVPYQDNEDYHYWAATGSFLYFEADDGHGFALWRTDGSTLSLIERPPTSYAFNLKVFGNAVLYLKSANGAPQYWRTDGTTAGTYALKNGAGQPITYSSNYWYANILISGGMIYFIGSDGGPLKLWRSNGTPTGATAIASSLPGASATFDGILFCVFPNGTIFFEGPSIPSNTGYGLWSFDGTNVTFLANMKYGNASLLATQAGSYAVLGSGGELWRSDGTIGGTYVLGTTNGSDGYHNWPMTALGTSVLMGGYDTTYGNELWKTDGTVANTGLLKDVQASTWGSYPYRLKRVPGGIVFWADSSAATDPYTPRGQEIWFSDGTEAGTQRLLADGHFTYSEPVSCGSLVYFDHETDGNGDELWTTNGTAAGTSMLADLYPGTSGGYANGSSPRSMLCIDDHLFFQARDADGWALWRSDGTVPGTYKIKNVDNYDPYGRVVQYGHGLFFFTQYSVWASNGTAEGTFKLKTFNDPLYGLYTAGSYAYWVEDDMSNRNYKLWRSDATAGGTNAILTQDWIGPQESINRRLIFTSSVNNNGNGYCSIGDAADVVCFDPVLGGSSSWVTSFKSLNGRIYYNKPDVMSTDMQTSRAEGYTADRLLAVAGGRLYLTDDSSRLRESDGTTTAPRTFLYIGRNGSVLESGGRLFIAADELWAYDLSLAAVSMSPASVPSSGGQPVTISGRGFAGPVTVTVGGNVAAVGATSATSITFTAPPHDPGTYTVTVYNGDGKIIDVPTPLGYTCSGPSAVINSAPVSVCPSTPVQLQGSGGTQCHWFPATGLNDPGSCTPVATVTKTTTWTLLVQNASGCPSSNSPSITIQIYGLPDATITLPSGTISPFNSYTASVPDAGPGATYQWSATGVTITSDPTLRSITFHTGCDLGKLTAIVTNANGCSSSKTSDVYTYAQVSVTNTSPRLVVPGMTITVTGSGFACVNQVNIVNGYTVVPVPYTIDSTTSLHFQMAPWPSGGYAYVKTPSAGDTGSLLFRLRRDDFTSDGKSDIVWRNPSTGMTLIWSLYSDNSIRTLTPFVRQSGTTDFNFSGMQELGGYLGIADTLWQKTSTGELSSLLINSSGAPYQETAWPVIPPATLKVAVLSDLDGDGRGEAIMRDTQSGATSLWKFDGTNFSQTPIHAGGNLDWSIVAARDFDFDGKEDILWRNNNSGATLIWFMDGATIRSSQWVHFGGNTDWTIAGAGDFDGDGKADILWRYNASGATLIWQMSGAQIVSSTFVHYGSNLNWKVAGVGDFDGDGKSDILWRETSTGRTLYWRMAGSQIVSSINLHPGGNLEWEIVGPSF